MYCYKWSRLTLRELSIGRYSYTTFKHGVKKPFKKKSHLYFVLISYPRKWFYDENLLDVYIQKTHAGSLFIYVAYTNV